VSWHTFSRKSDLLLALLPARGRVDLHACLHGQARQHRFFQPRPNRPKESVVMLKNIAWAMIALAFLAGGSLAEGRSEAAEGEVIRPRSVTVLEDAMDRKRPSDETMKDINALDREGYRVLKCRPPRKRGSKVETTYYWYLKLPPARYSPEELIKTDPAHPLRHVIYEARETCP